MPQKAFAAGSFPWDKGSAAAARPQRQAAPQVSELDQRLASISLASQQREAEIASEKESYDLRGRNILSAFSEITTAQLGEAAEDCEVDSNDIPLLLGMVAAMKQRPEIKSKISQQIAGMGQLQSVEILNIDTVHTTQEVLDMITKLDQEALSAVELSRYTVMNTAISNASGFGLSKYTSMRIDDLPISDKMLSTWKQGGLDGMEDWYVRPHHTMPYRGDLPALVIKPTEGGRKLLALLVAAGMNKVEIEQLLKSQLTKNWRTH
jgi:hypothetical protein